MIVEKEVTIYVESFVDALEIVDKMDDSLPHSIIFMDEEEFLEGKCHVVIGKTLFMFLPVVHRLFKAKKPENIHLSLKREEKDNDSDK